MSRTVYKAPLAVGVRGVGVGAIGMGLATLGVTLGLSIGPDGWIGTVLIVALVALGAISCLILLVGLLRLWGRGPRLSLDDEGFLNATGFRSGVRRGHWRDVRKVQADGRIVSVDLAGGRQSLIDTSVIGVDPRTLARDLRTRLNRDRGYHPIGRQDDLADG